MKVPKIFVGENLDGKTEELMNKPEMKKLDFSVDELTKKLPVYSHDPLENSDKEPWYDSRISEEMQKPKSNNGLVSQLTRLYDHIKNYEIRTKKEKIPDKVVLGRYNGLFVQKNIKRKYYVEAFIMPIGYALGIATNFFPLLAARLFQKEGEIKFSKFYKPAVVAYSLVAATQGFALGAAVGASTFSSFVYGLYPFMFNGFFADYKNKKDSGYFLELTRKKQLHDKNKKLEDKIASLHNQRTDIASEIKDLTDYLSQ